MADDSKKCPHERYARVATADSDYCHAYSEAASGTIVSNALAALKCA